jgi:hypothetical protein
MNRAKLSSLNSDHHTTTELLKKLDEQAKAQGLDSGLLLMAKQSPAMADIMSRMIDAELSNVKKS